MLIKNITDRTSPKPIGIGNTVIMPGVEEYVPDSVVYVEVFDKMGKRTGKRILPAVVTMAAMHQLEYKETPKTAAVTEETEESISEQEESEATQEISADKPKRGRAKKTA